MIKCKQAEESSDCGKTICCFNCEEKNTCKSVCGVLDDLKKDGVESPLDKDGCDDAFEVNEENAVQVFENKAALIIQAITDIVTQKKVLEEKEAIMREKIEKAMGDYGVNKFENDQLSITYVKATTRAIIDSKSLKKDLPDIAAKYTKVSNVKASIKISVK
nr:hypothetical protein [uncultured Anaerocolumna sp.]